MIAHTVIALAVGLLTSCSVHHTPGGATRFDIGEDAELEFYKHSLAGGGESISLKIGKTQSDSFKQATSAAKTWLRISGLKDISGDVFKYLGDRNANDAAQAALETRTDADQSAIETAAQLEARQLSEQ